MDDPESAQSADPLRAVPAMSAVDRPAGVARLLKRRARRVPATWLLGRDPRVAALPRMLARLLSAYERATIRAVLLALLQKIPFLDEPFLWLGRRTIFALAGRPRGDDDPALDLGVPGSGWAGNLLVVAVWGSASAALVRLLG